MALAFVAAGTPTAQDVGISGGTVTAPVPAGLAAGQLLFAYVLYDSNETVPTPAGWSPLWSGKASGGTSTPSFFYPQLQVFSKIASGSETGVTFTFSTAGYPAGNAFVTAAMLSYSGSAGSPVELASYTFGAPAAAEPQAHPQLTTATASDWLLTIRATSDNEGAADTFTNSVGTDVSRLTSSAFGELTLGWFDSNTALASGLQTQRSTTASDSPYYGSVMVSVAVKPASGVATTAQAGEPVGTGQVFTPTVTAGALGWQCDNTTLPLYTLAVDWEQDGLTAPGKILNPANPYSYYDASSWSGQAATVAWSNTPLGGRSVPCVLTTPDGSGSTGGALSYKSGVGTVVPGQNYIADCWVWSPSATGTADRKAVIDWYDSSGVFLSTSGLSLTTVIPSQKWTHLQQTLTAPASASQGVARCRHPAATPAADPYYVYGLLLMDPSLAETRLTPGPLDVLMQDFLSGGMTAAYGRDQFRQITPAAIGSAALAVNNVSRNYSPENVSSPLNGMLDTARVFAAQVYWNGQTYGIFHGRLDDYDVHADRADRTVSFTFQDDEAFFQNTKVTTPLYQGIRTGTAVSAVLDAVGWTGPRAIDPGSTVMPWWWLSAVTASTAINDLVASEGPPAIFYIAPDGTAVFRDRSHRLISTRSTSVQASFYAPKIQDCTATTTAAGTLGTTPPYTYKHGARDIVNSVVFTQDVRQPASGFSNVWTSQGTYAISNGTTLSLTITATDPFLNLQLPDPTQGDYTLTGAGTVSAALSQTSGGSAVLTLTAVGGDVVVTGLQLRGISVPVVSTVTVSQQDSASIGQHGQVDYGQSAPWASPYDAYAIAGSLVLRYAQRRPTVSIQVEAKDPQHYAQVVGGTISDLVLLQNDELGLNSPFYVEHVAHTVTRINRNGLPPVHAVVLGCEAQPVVVTNPFTFDLARAGFDYGVFDPPGSDNPATVFVFDDPTRGVFDFGRLGT